MVGEWESAPLDELLLADDVILTSEAPLGEAAYLRAPVD